MLAETYPATLKRFMTMDADEKLEFDHFCNKNNFSH